MLMGSRPFSGPDWPEFREQHLHEMPPELTGVPAAIASLIDECLYKAAGARPTPANLLARLERANAPSSPAVSRLQEVSQKIVAEQSKALASASAATSEKERREALFKTADESLKAIGDQLRQAILDNGPATPDPRSTHAGWALRLGDTTIGMDPATRVALGKFGPWQPPFDLIASSIISINIPPGAIQFHGRAHSLWYGDIQEKGVYRWFETAFMISPMLSRRSTHLPTALEPGEASGAAIGRGNNEWQLARPFVPIDLGETTAFIERWIDWLALAAAGELAMPNSLPELSTDGSWRRS
jgi:serine/threonine-protein kinase